MQGITTWYFITLSIGTFNMLAYLDTGSAVTRLKYNIIHSVLDVQINLLEDDKEKHKLSTQLEVCESFVLPTTHIEEMLIYISLLRTHMKQLYYNSIQWQLITSVSNGITSLVSLKALIYAKYIQMHITQWVVLSISHTDVFIKRDNK